MKRTKLRERMLPDYTKGEEIMNMVTHIVGGAMGIVVLVLCILRSVSHHSVAGVIGSVVYGVSMILLYTVSSVYHGLRPNMGKRVMQVIDHCAIYFLIAGTYTPVMLSAFVPAYPAIGWSILAAEWLLAAIATTLTAIDLHNYKVFSMVCYIFMGWGILFFVKVAMAVLGATGFYLLLAGGIAYTIGAILYGIGSKMHWMHSVFHIFVLLGSLLHFLSIYLYVL